jgi:hypothetical protein
MFGNGSKNHGRVTPHIHLNMRDLKAAHRKFHPTSFNSDEVIQPATIKNESRQQFFAFVSA